MVIHQVGEMKRNKIRGHRIGRIRILIRLCSLPLHSPCTYLLLTIGLATTAVAGECMHDAQVNN